MSSFKLISVCALAVCAVSASAMGGTGDNIPVGTDVITRDEYSALSLRLSCAQHQYAPHHISKTGQGIVFEAYTHAGSAYRKHNRAEFDRFAKAFNTDIDNMQLGC